MNGYGQGAIALGVFVLIGGIFAGIFYYRSRKLIRSLEVREEGLSLISGRGRLWLPLNEIEEITLVNKEADPLIDDVIWELVTLKGVKLEIPDGIKGSKELLERLQRLPGFDNDAVIESMSAFSSSRRLCWKRKA